MKLKLILYFMGFVLPLFGQTVHYQHTTFWMRCVLTAPLSKKWDFYTDYIHRQQNDLGAKSPFPEPSLRQLRLWLYYKKGDFTFQINPFSYVKSFQSLGKLSDYNVPPNLEYRFAVAGEWKQTAGKFTFKERGQYEYRLLKFFNYAAVYRGRLRGLVQYAFTDKTKLSLSEEYWYNLPPRKVHNKFDQNWLLLNVSQQLTKTFALEFGYRYSTKERNSLTEFDYDNGIDIAANFKF